MPNLAIVGYGKMGRLIDQLAPEYGFTVTAKVGRNSPGRNSDDALAGTDVAVEFTEPGAVLANVAKLASARVPVVIGTTGWGNDLERVRSLIESNQCAAVASSNFSIGVNVFLQVVAQASTLLRDEGQYEAWGWEIHHAMKKDAPSGTMNKLIEQMKSAGYVRPISVSSNRSGAHPGTHEIGFDSPADTITLRHTARSREGFARGALKAAQWIIGRQGFYEFSDVLFGG